MVHTALKCIFLHIPRTAGTSITHALNKIPNPIDYGAYSHEQTAFYKKHYADEWSSYFKFAVVRNPYEKVYSSYKRRHGDRSFKEYLIWLNDNDIQRSANVIGSQKLWLGDKKDSVFVIRFENLNEGWEKVQQELNIDIPLPHINSTEKDNYKDHYTSFCRKLVEKHFEWDFNNLGYTYDK